MNDFPAEKRDAQTDLAGNVAGRFSPEDWERILEIARQKLETRSWPDVVREFHRENYWGFRPDWRPPAVPYKFNLGYGMLWMTFSTFVLTLMALAWLGQNYATSGQAKDGYLFCAALALALLNFVYFLWRSRGYRD
jgi:hypothetical protein